MGGVNIVPPLAGDAELPQTHGLVVARVVNAGNVPLPFNYLTIAPKNLNESSAIKASRLSSLESTTGDSTLFASSIAPGSYSVSNIRAFYSFGESWYSRWASGDIEMGTFDVAANQVTDLGTLVYYPKVLEDRYVDTLIRVPNSKALPTLTGYLPFLEEGNRKVAGWNNDDLSEDRMSKYISALQNPVVFNDRYKATDGSIYFIGKLGTILRRTAEGEWLMEALDTDSDLNNITLNDAGDIVTGGEFGKIYLKRAGGEWKNIYLDNRYNIQEILFTDGGNIIDVIAKHYGELAVFRMDTRESSPKWGKLLSYTSRTGWKDSDDNPLGIGTTRRPDVADRRISYIHTQHLNGINYLYFGTQPGGNASVLASSRHMIFSYDPQSWSLEVSDGFDKNIDRIIPAGTTQLGVKQPGFWSMTNKNKYYRFDSAQNQWVKMETRFDHCRGSGGLSCKKDDKRIQRYTEFDLISVPVFSSDKDAFAVVKDRNSKKHDTLIAVTDNGGDSWVPADFKLPRDYCTSTVPEWKDAILIYCNGSSSDFYESHDEGKTWDHVRQHQNF